MPIIIISKITKCYDFKALKNILTQQNVCKYQVLKQQSFFYNLRHFMTK